MNLIRAKGIPIWVTILAILVGVMGTFLGVSALFDPTSAAGFIDGATELAFSWAGRNTGLGFALVLAVLVRRPGGYAVAWGASLWRELSDILNAGIGTGIGIGLSVFLLIEIVCFVISIRAALAENGSD